MAMNYDVKDANAILKSNIPDGLVSENLRFDSAEDASVFFARELDYVKAKSYDKQYPQFTAEQNFPISHEVNEGADTVTYYSYEKTGFAKIISNYAQDLPRADVKGHASTAMVKSIGASYGYSMQDMRASRMAGKSLDARRAESARYQIAKTSNEIAWAGNKEAGLMGVISKDNNVPVYTIPKGASQKTGWADKTPDEIIADITGMLAFMSDTTMGVEIPDTLMIPPAVWISMTKKRLDGTASSVLKYVQDNFPEITFKQAPELDAKSTGTNPYGLNVAFLFKNDPDKFTVEIPLPYYQYTAQPKGLEIEIPCEERTAGAIIYYPMSMLIATGV